MDGFHYYKSYLDKLDSSENEVKSHYYRGAYWTFDSGLFLQRIQDLKNLDKAVVKFPSFDHAVGDPEEDKFLINKHSADGSLVKTIIIIEGLYLLFDNITYTEDP